MPAVPWIQGPLDDIRDDGGLGLALVAGIAVAARLASRDRHRLLALCRPGLYLTAIAIAVIVLRHGLIAIMTIVFLTGMFVSGPVLAIPIGMVAGAVAVIRNVFAVVKTAESEVIGRPVYRDEAPALWQLIDGWRTGLAR